MCEITWYYFSFYLLFLEIYVYKDHAAGDANNSDAQGESDEPKEQGKKVKILPYI